MILTWPVVAAVLLGALLHASWNALVKSSADKALDTAIISLIGAVLAIPLLLVVGLPPRAAWPYIALSVILHIGYYVALAGAHRFGDLGLTYPMMRGMGPVLVALTATATVGEKPSSLSWAGVLGVCAGVLALGVSRAALEQPKAVAFASINAVIIALYTVVDALGARTAVGHGGTALQYVTGLFELNGWPYALLVLHRRGLATS